MCPRKFGVVLGGGSSTRFGTGALKALAEVDGVPIIVHQLRTLAENDVDHAIVTLGSTDPLKVIECINKHVTCPDVYYVWQGEPSGFAQAVYCATASVKENDQFVVLTGDNYLRGVSFRWLDDSSEWCVFSYIESETSTTNGPTFGAESRPNVPVSWRERRAGEVANYVFAGYCVFDGRYGWAFSRIVPSSRGEYEISSIMDICQRENGAVPVRLDVPFYDVATLDDLLALRKAVENGEE